MKWIEKFSTTQPPPKSQPNMQKFYPTLWGGLRWPPIPSTKTISKKKRNIFFPSTKIPSKTPGKCSNHPPKPVVQLWKIAIQTADEYSLYRAPTKIKTLHLFCLLSSSKICHPMSLLLMVQKSSKAPCYVKKPISSGRKTIYQP